MAFAQAVGVKPLAVLLLAALLTLGSLGRIGTSIKRSVIGEAIANRPFAQPTSLGSIRIAATSAVVRAASKAPKFLPGSAGALGAIADNARFSTATRNAAHRTLSIHGLINAQLEAPYPFGADVARSVPFGNSPATRRARAFEAVAGGDNPLLERAFLRDANRSSATEGFEFDSSPQKPWTPPAGVVPSPTPPTGTHVESLATTWASAERWFAKQPLRDGVLGDDPSHELFEIFDGQFRLAREWVTWASEHRAELPKTFVELNEDATERLLARLDDIIQRGTARPSDVERLAADTVLAMDAWDPVGRQTQTHRLLAQNLENDFATLIWMHETQVNPNRLTSFTEPTARFSMRFFESQLPHADTDPLAAEYIRSTRRRGLLTFPFLSDEVIPRRVLGKSAYHATIPVQVTTGSKNIPHPHPIHRRDAPLVFSVSGMLLHDYFHAVAIGERVHLDAFVQKFASRTLDHFGDRVGHELLFEAFHERTTPLNESVIGRVVNEAGYGLDSDKAAPLFDWVRTNPELGWMRSPEGSPERATGLERYLRD